jgi:serine protease Do
VLEVEGQDLPAVNIGNSDELEVGDWVVAIGSPFSFDFSVTAGIVSAKGRSIQNNNIGNYVPFLQTDVAINPGNSGGPLFNLEGGVVGINSQIYSRSGGYQGLAFSIPINVALDVADQIITNGEVKRGYLGVRMSEVDSDLAEALGMSKPYGALINDVEDGESADNAGLQPGDVIIEFNKKEIKFSSDLPHVVGQIKPGSNAKGKVIRDGKTKILNFTLGELPSSNDRFIPAKATTSDDPLGLKVAEIDRDNPAMSNAPDGVMVTRVNLGSPASGKILRGDIISMIQSKSKKYEIYNTDDFEFVVEELNSDDKVAVHIFRNGSRIITSLKVN